MPWAGRRMEELSAEEIEERSVLMRLWRSHLADEEFYPARFVNGAAAGLLARGLIERVGEEGWRITPAGCEEWARMAAPVMGPDVALRRIVEGERMECVVEGCERARMVGGNGRVLTMCPDHQREYWRKDKAKKAGGAVEALPEEPKSTRGRKKKDVTKAVEAPHPWRREYPAPVPRDEGPGETCEGCEQGCIYREVVEMMAGVNPAVRQLIEAKQAERAALAALGIGQKKTGEA